MLNTRKPTNPKHHNAGRVGTFNQDLTRHLSFLNLQLKGFTSNIGRAVDLLEYDKRNPQWNQLPESNQLVITLTIIRLRNIQSELKEMSYYVAEFNRDKHKIPNLKTVKSTFR